VGPANLDGGTRGLTKIADDVKSFYPTNDGTMIAALENHSLEIFSENGGGYYRFNLPNRDQIKSLIWYKDDAHLFVVYNDSVAFLDLTDAGLHNFPTIANGTSPRYDPQINALYIVDNEGRLIRLDFSG
jgi:hypothetical protein